MNNKFILLIVFSLAWFSSSVYSSYFDNNDSNIDSITNNNEDKKMIDLSTELKKFEKLISNANGENKDKISPHDWIKTDQIFVYPDQVIIKIQDAEWSIFTDTNSMDPVIDSESSAIEIIPKSEEDIHLGDIVAYKSNYKSGTVTHRIVEIGNDSFGWYARLKGDNNDRIDPGKVRFEQIKRVVVAIIY